ncbi:hypothetical protein BDW42DRAFT_162454 [Aspergillus taichungensis]|uniref:Secreted protein n=1 Tax=Aspergillus taichungensis TaxID=482145 RepID=A0A2J5I3T7_9EURO|nr:hypothetical protein BDW42DRAFT_162454 [Aspergillus taichungensis]
MWFVSVGKCFKLTMLYVYGALAWAQGTLEGSQCSKWRLHLSKCRSLLWCSGCEMICAGSRSPCRASSAARIFSALSNDMAFGTIRTRSHFKQPLWKSEPC